MTADSEKTEHLITLINIDYHLTPGNLPLSMHTLWKGCYFPTEIQCFMDDFVLLKIMVDPHVKSLIPGNRNEIQYTITKSIYTGIPMKGK